MYRHDDEVEGAAAAAAVAVPLILKRVGAVTSVVDVGGGTGAWLREFVRHGVREVRLLDVPAVRPGLLIDPAAFQPADLSAAIPELPRADLAVCLECAEHLPPARGPELVGRLTAAADRVVFSAAPPGQGGKGHINLRPPGYWAGEFGERGFRRYDILRGDFLRAAAMPYWYAQNTFLFCRAGTTPAAPADDLLPEGFHLVHDRVMDGLASPGVRQSCGLVGAAVLRAVRRRLG